jgi:uncharacterized membrane protein
MKSTVNFLKQTIIAGIFFLVPVLLIAYLFKKLWEPLHALIVKASETLHIDHLLGKTLLAGITVLSILLMCMLAGLLMRLHKVGKWNEWIETNVLRFMPGYVFIKQIMSEKLQYEQNTSQLKKPVLVMLDDNWIVGILAEYSAETNLCVVYLPGSPEFNSGSVCLVELNRVRLLPYTFYHFKKSVEHFGNGLSDIKIADLPELK